MTATTDKDLQIGDTVMVACTFEPSEHNVPGPYWNPAMNVCVGHVGIIHSFVRGADNPGVRIKSADSSVDLDWNFPYQSLIKVTLVPAKEVSNESMYIL